MAQPFVVKYAYIRFAPHQKADVFRLWGTTWVWLQSCPSSRRVSFHGWRASLALVLISEWPYSSFTSLTLLMTVSYPGVSRVVHLVSRPLHKANTHWFLRIALEKSITAQSHYYPSSIFSKSTRFRNWSVINHSLWSKRNVIRAESKKGVGRFLGSRRHPSPPP